VRRAGKQLDSKAEITSIPRMSRVNASVTERTTTCWRRRVLSGMEGTKEETLSLLESTYRSFEGGVEPARPFGQRISKFSHRSKEFRAQEFDPARPVDSFRGLQYRPFETRPVTGGLHYQTVDLQAALQRQNQNLNEVISCYPSLVTQTARLFWHLAQSKT